MKSAVWSRTPQSQIHDHEGPDGYKWTLENEDPDTGDRTFWRQDGWGAIQRAIVPERYYFKHWRKL